MTAMNSRERLLTALTCETPDRVPVNTYELDGLNTQSWYNQQPSYQALMNFIRAHSDCIANWDAATGDQVLSGDNTYILGSSHPVPIDCTVERDGTRERSTWMMHTPRGDLRRVLERDDRVQTTWVIEHWCKSVEDVDKALSVRFEPIEYDAGDYPRIREEVGDRGLIMSSLSDPAYLAADLMSFQDYTTWAYEHPDHFARAVDVTAPRVMENLRRMLEACVVDLYRICGPEYMTPPYLPPAYFERFMSPHITAMTEMIHQFGGYVRLHCHGRISRVLDMILDSGCDGTDPCEPPPDGDIELDEVKRRCAERQVSVWGNVELKVLEQGTTQQVRDTVQQIMDQAKAGGGFVLLPTAGPINVPLSPKTEGNYMTMIESAVASGAY